MSAVHDLPLEIERNGICITIWEDLARDILTVRFRGHDKAGRKRGAMVRLHEDTVEHDLPVVGAGQRYRTLDVFGWEEIFKLRDENQALKDLLASLQPKEEEA